MTSALETRPSTSRTVDARGSFCPGPLMELIRAIRETQVGDVISVLSSDSGSKIDIPKWVEKAGHRLVSLGKIVFNKTYFHTVPRGRV